jgi:4-hydroxy-2-oxovalerate aldolase
MQPFGSDADILDVTLRDGSYLVDFQFTAEDTATAVGALSAVGFRWIEVGHGLGMSASTAGKGRAAASDQEYLEAAAAATKTARWGMFFIPGLGRADDLRLAARFGMHFVRIGTNLRDMAEARPFIDLAKELGLLVSYNGMKSYSVSPPQFARCAAEVRRWGADLVCLVDSAGGMYPDDVAAYFQATRGETDIALGFHGHDNLSLAVANTLRAVECGAALVDASLQGVGRSAGNAVSEVLVAVLKKQGLLAHIDLKGVMDLGQGLIKPSFRRRGLDPMAITSGYARFHSGFASKVEAYARKNKLDVRDLIMRLCREDQVEAPDAVLERLSGQLAQEQASRVLSLPVFSRTQLTPERGMESLRAMLAKVRSLAAKTGKSSTLNVTTSAGAPDDIRVSNNIEESPTHVVGTMSWSTLAQLGRALDAIDGWVEMVLLDTDPSQFRAAEPASIARRSLRKTLLLTYSDSQVWINAVEDQVVRLLDEVANNAPVTIAGDHARSRRLALWLAERGARVTLLTEPDELPQKGAHECVSFMALEPARLDLMFAEPGSAEGLLSLREASVVVVWPRTIPWFGTREMAAVRKEAYVLDAGMGGIGQEALTEGRARGVRFLRVDMWPTLIGVLAGVHRSVHVRRHALGWGMLGGVPIVAGGALGQRGDVIVDSVTEPTRVIGVADGSGGMLSGYGQFEADRVRRVSEQVAPRVTVSIFEASANERAVTS